MPGEPPLDVQIRNTTKNVAILLTKVHNLQVEVKELRSENRRFAEAVIRLLYSPEMKTDMKHEMFNELGEQQMREKGGHE